MWRAARVLPPPEATYLELRPPFNCAATAAQLAAGVCRGDYSRGSRCRETLFCRAHRSSLHFNLAETEQRVAPFEVWKRRQTWSFWVRVHATLVEYTLLRPLFSLVSIWRGDGQLLLLDTLQTRDFPLKLPLFFLFQLPGQEHSVPPRRHLMLGVKKIVNLLPFWRLS